jgi:hypothetical protein
MELEEARDILANCIDDYVIAEYCSSCDDKESCKDDDCIFHQAIEVVLNHLTKQDKMIDLMALAISSYDGQLVINQYKDRNEVKAKFEEYAVDGTYEQYFEKKAEESE